MPDYAPKYDAGRRNYNPIGLSYASFSGEVIALDGADVRRIDGGDAMRSYSWGYELGAGSISSQAIAPQERTIEVRVADLAEADRMRRAFAADVRAGRPGEFRYGEWVKRGYVTGEEAASYRPSSLVMKLSVLLLDGMWRRPRVISLRPGGSLADGKGYPHAFPYSYGLAEGFTRIADVGNLPGPVNIIVYGPATNPSVTIGGNRFAVDCSVPSGGYLEIDGVNLTVALVNSYGERENRLADAVRGSGVGSGEYIFEQVGGDGEVMISWPGTFGTDITYWEQEVAAPWTS